MKLVPNQNPPRSPDSQTNAQPSLGSPSENFSAKAPNADPDAVSYVLDVDWFPTRRKAISTAITHEGYAAHSAQHPEEVIRWVIENHGQLTHLLIGDYLIRVASIADATEEAIAQWPRQPHRS